MPILLKTFNQDIINICLHVKFYKYLNNNKMCIK